MIRLLSLAALLLSSNVNADTVTPIAETQSGDRLIAATETLTIKPNKNGVMVVSIVAYWASAPGDNVVLALDVASCSKGGGEMIAVNADTEHVTRYFWTAGGNRIYDQVGRQLCSVLPNQQNDDVQDEPGESV